jgi:hypothetical protein
LCHQCQRHRSQHEGRKKVSHGQVCFVS